MGASHGKKLSSKDMEFLRRNTKFTDDEIKKWHKEFMVACPKGRLTRDQFVRVYEDFFPCGDAKAFCDHGKSLINRFPRNNLADLAFRTFDATKTGYVDFKEFLSAINVMTNGTTEQKLEWAFRMYDIDGSGTIEEDEMIKILKAVHDMFKASTGAQMDTDDYVSQRAKVIFARMDKNHDKSLTFNEFMEGCLCDFEVCQLLTGGVTSKSEDM